MKKLKLTTLGFTLIELLAVIVILAIISLIAVPIVINIINDSKKSSDEQAVELYLDTVEKTITKKQLNDPNFNPDKCEIKDNGDLKCYKNNELIDTLQVEMKGKKPNKGEITILNNKFNYKNIWFNNKKYYAIATLLDDADNNNEISMGDKYEYKVNDIDTFKFYVLTDPKDGKVNLIMDRNICEDGTTDYLNDPDNNYCRYQWYFDQNNFFGPVVAMTKLYRATKNWTNVPYMDMSETKKYQDEGNSYGNMETTKLGINITNYNNDKVENENGTLPTIMYENNQSLKARLPKYNEVYKEDNSLCTGNFGTCLYWLVDNLNENDNYSSTLYPKKNNITEIYGYWTLSSHPNYSSGSYYVRVISYNGNIGISKANKSTGIRPVITIPISDLE